MNGPELGFYDLVQLLKARRRILIGATVATTFLALALALFSKPQYLAESVLAPLSTNMESPSVGGLGSSLSGLASIVGLGSKSGADDIAQNIAILRSRALADRFINEYQLAPILFSKRWDAVHKRWKVGTANLLGVAVSRVVAALSGDVGAPHPGNGAPSADEIYRAFDHVRSVDVDDRTGLVTLGMKWRDPVVAAAWAREYVTTANDYIRAQKVSEAQRSLEYLRIQIQKTNLTEIHDALYKLVETETKQAMLANVREQFAFKIIDPATVPDRRVSPKRTIMVAVGIMGGLMLGLALVLLQNYFAVMRKARFG